MSICLQTAGHFRDVFFGGNWTSVNLKSSLAGTTWQQATAQVHHFNTIATLTFHIGYYVDAVLKVLQGGPLDASDKFSFAHPPITSQQDWDEMVNTVLTNAEAFAVLVEQLPENRLNEAFTDGKYGTWFRNIQGITEHTHYHLGQIVLIKKILQEESSNG